MAAIDEGVDFLGVANAEEGALLRYQGIDIPILILSPSFENEIDLILEYNLIPTVSDIEFAHALDIACDNRPIPIHINIDTGMGRSGVHHTEAAEIIREIAQKTNLRIEGIFSHLASSEEDQDFSLRQYSVFLNVLRQLEGIVQPRWIHLCNSAGAVAFRDVSTDDIHKIFPDAKTLVRLGLLSYGVYPHASFVEHIDLKPVMTFKTRVGQIKKAFSGESIGYNRTYRVQRDMRYAILPVGYADGYDFLFSGCGGVMIREKSCSVLGRVSMDMIAVSLENIEDAQVGDEVIVLGGEMRVENLVRLYGGSSYELLCQVGRRARRYFIDREQIVSSAPLARRDFFSPDFSDNRLNRIIEASIRQRLDSKEIAGIIYRDVLSRFFRDKDHDIRYRTDFIHTIEFIEPKFPGEYLITQTALTFRKQLQNDYFIVACANNPEYLQRYFERNDVEYRWLLDDSLALDEELFDVLSPRIDDIELHAEKRIIDGCIEIRCHHPELKNLVGKEVEFSIPTRTWYPAAANQMSVFINEPTRGVQVRFSYPPSIRKVDPVAIFAGKTRFPEIRRENHAISVSVESDQWVLPNSGIVFSYNR